MLKAPSVLQGRGMTWQRLRQESSSGRAAACLESEQRLCMNSGRGKVVVVSVLGVQLMLTRHQKLRLQFLDVAGLQNTSRLSGQRNDAETGAAAFAGGQQLCDLMKDLHGVLVLGMNTRLASCRFSVGLTALCCHRSFQ